MTKGLEARPEAGAEAVVVGEDSLNKDKYDSLLEMAERIESVVAAQNKIRTAVLKCAMPGDFVQFGDKVELAGPGAERIGALVGISVTNISDEKTSWEDKNGKAFTWRYIGDVSIGKRVIEKVEGRAGSRSKFFGFEKGEWKELADVNESDIRTSARRCLYKEGLKLLLGLRSLPADPAFLISIGLDPAKVKKVEHGKSGSSGATGPAPSDEKTPLLLKHVGQRKFTKKDKTEGIIYVIEDERGTKYETFSESMAKAAASMCKAGKKVLLDWEPNGKFAPKLSAISEADPTASQDAPGDAQEPTDQEPNT